MLKVTEITSTEPTTTGWSIEIGINEANTLHELRNSVLADLNSRAENKRKYLTDEEKVRLLKVLYALTCQMFTSSNAFENIDISHLLEGGTNLVNCQFK